ncbi:thermitase Serine peptidase. MEROPS family S08A [Halobacillus karajensis]|uniref:Thermophilic serine proteinase n=1 Tax=Halobacillus karajensis TaxID=195088 RepID=A0A024P2P7_9BACI|nr:S8 family peptidase [Halobacillus karajensis]CDQ19163.1 Thermophilic serine proteinase precursor [Halobacillus karajensis]CDQ22763.1 Thermophilic serine proteinase precursor [Halobacillus karajensis]CDQ26245.1 Thermophilic serine proteinase precursor [Halobacillus karajensis]SEH40667.1 thermitase Serine peptidase. MEROPS family S08A [Halobacillus karajensis]
MKFKKLATLSLAASLALLPTTGQAFAETQPESLNKVKVQEDKGEFVKGEVVVKYKEGKSLKGKQLESFGAETLEDSKVVDSEVKVLKVGNVEKAVKALNKNPNVEYAEPNYVFNATWSPNDTYYSSHQYGPQNTNTEAAWDITRGSSNQEIAIVDSGVDYNHPDLAGKTIKGYDFVDNDYDPMDLNNHGTHVAGTAAAITNNGSGVAGMAPNTSILAVRALDANGSGSLYDIADAIRYSADEGAEVINLSLGCDCDTQTLENAVNYAWNKGSVVIAAAGNDGVSTTFEPASYDNVIAVGAVDSNNNKASFSNYGTWVDVTAPGVDIASTVPNGGYAYMSGTSMASPHVAGLAGLLASQGRSNSNIRAAIEQTADPISGTGYYFEHGLINSYNAVNY